MDCSSPGSSVRGIFQARVLEWGCHCLLRESPTLCHIFINQPLSIIRQKYPQAYVIHYMDDILLAYPDNQLLHHIFLDTQNILKEFGLIIAPDKIQKIIIWDTFLIVIQYPLKRYKLELITLIL